MKKILILVLIILLLLIIGVYYFFFLEPEKIRKTVLTSLEKEYEFCEIIKDEIFLNSGKFWMICNGRPFYAEYKNKLIYYDNGWSSLWEEPSLWEELKNCNFYDSEISGNIYKLMFYCISDELKLKILSFNLDNWKAEKTDETSFIDFLSKRIKEIYSFLTSCDVENYTVQSVNDNFPTIILKFKCSEGYYQLWVDMNSYSLTPPILINNLSKKERAELSFQKSFNCRIDNITENNEEVNIFSSSCKNSSMNIIYNFKHNVAYYSIDCDLEECIQLTPGFIILKTSISNPRILSSPPDVTIFKNNGKILFFYKQGNNAVFYGVKNEKME